MSDHDDDVPAIEAPPERVGDPQSPVAVEDDGPIYRRVVNETTRTLFKKAAESLSKQIDDGAEVGDDEVPAIPPPDEKPVAAAAPASPGATQAGTASPPAAAAAPALDAAASRAALQLEIREKAVSDREKALEPLMGQRDRYLDNSSSAIKDLVKEWTGATTDEELKDEVADLISELSSNVLGLGVSQEIKSRLDSKRALRQVKSYKADISKREAELAKKSEAEQQANRERLAVDALGQQLRTAASEYPHLMSRDEPHAIVWDVIKTKASREPEWQPNWAEAAKLAEAHYKTLHEKQYQTLARLFAPTAKQPAVEASNQGAPQSRGARTLTNAVSAPTTPEQPVNEDEPYDREAHRRRSLGKLRARMSDRQT